MADLVERIARAMEPRAFEIVAEKYPVASNFIAIRRFLNAEKVVRRARKKAAIAIAEYRAVENEAMQKAWEGFSEEDLKSIAAAEAENRDG